MKNLRRIKTITELSVVEDLVALIERYCLKVIKLGIGGEYISLNAWKLSNEYTGLSDCIIFNQKETKLEITTKYLEGKPCTYVFDLNKENKEANIQGQQAYAQLQKCFKAPDAKDYNIPELDKWFDYNTGKYVCSAKPILGYNKTYEKQELKDCYEYDLNSAYSSVLSNKIPDVNSPTYYPEMGKVKENEVGFLLDDDLTMVRPGNWADVVFPLIDAPDGLKLFCNKYFTIKQNTSGTARNAAKAMLNYPIGYYQRKNPFVRAYVVHSCNRVIKNLLNADTLFYNTDAIFSKVRRPDLQLGRGIGQFKEIKCESIKYIGNVYQVNDDIPKYRGVPKAYFKRFEQLNGRKFDILKDTITERKCLYSFNFTTMRMEKNYEEEIE